MENFCDKLPALLKQENAGPSKIRNSSLTARSTWSSQAIFHWTVLLRNFLYCIISHISAGVVVALEVPWEPIINCLFPILLGN